MTMFTVLQSAFVPQSYSAGYCRQFGGLIIQALVWDSEGF